MYDIRRPTVKTLSRIWPDSAKQIRKLLDGFDHDQNCHISFPAVQVLEKINELLDGYGVEGFAFNTIEGFNYVNFGDTYDVTILFESTGRYSGRFLVTSWGDYYERTEHYKKSQ